LFSHFSYHHIARTFLPLEVANQKTITSENDLLIILKAAILTFVPYAFPICHSCVFNKSGNNSTKVGGD